MVRNHSYARGKLREAIFSLATGPGDIRKRLIQAHNAFFIRLKNNQFPVELQSDWKWIKTLLFGCLILLGLFSCNQNNPRNSNSNKTPDYSMSVLHKKVTNDLTNILSGYIEKDSEPFEKDNMKFLISIIRFSSTDFELIQLGVNGYSNILHKYEGISVEVPWKRDTNRSYPSYTLSLKKDGTSDFIILTYQEINNNKELRIATTIK